MFESDHARDHTRDHTRQGTPETVPRQAQSMNGGDKTRVQNGESEAIEAQTQSHAPSRASDAPPAAAGGRMAGPPAAVQRANGEARVSGLEESAGSGAPPAAGAGAGASAGAGAGAGSPVRDRASRTSGTPSTRHPGREGRAHRAPVEAAATSRTSSRREPGASRGARSGQEGRAGRELPSGKRMMGLAPELFVSLVAHELRTPVTGIAAHAWALDEYWDRLSEEQRRESVTTIRQRAHHLQRLVSDLLLATRAHVGQPLVASSRAVLLGPIVERVARDIGRERGRTVVTDIQADAPPVTGDADRIEQVLVNLIDNALKYSAEETEVRVCLTADSPEEVRCCIEDQGLGISEEEQKTLFQPFVRVQRAADAGLGQTGGTGLGLYVCKMIVETLHGRIWVESEPERGSRFWCAFNTWTGGVEA